MGPEILETLDRLKQVTQGRSFTHDTLGRLVTTVNPESGTTCYGEWVGGVCQGGYDPNSSLVKKTDARGVVTTVNYDSLNRVLTKSYSDGTATVGYMYDTDLAITGVSNENRSIGRLVQVTGGTGSTVYRWDGVGRAVASGQEMDGTGYVFEYGHKPAGPGTMRYPSGRVVNWGYDDVGRVDRRGEGCHWRDGLCVVDSVLTVWRSGADYTRQYIGGKMGLQRHARPGETDCARHGGERDRGGRVAVQPLRRGPVHGGVQVQQRQCAAPDRQPAGQDPELQL